jgi:thiosulfate/3-mercaptopyruvate sulfurtransferase
MFSVNAQYVSVNELSKMINQPNVVVIDARPSADYLKTHIKGAIGLDVTSLCNNSPVEGTLKSATEIASILGKNGISNNSKVVVYCKTGISAGRMYWILKYLGCADVSILDGQMAAWFAGRKPITKVATNLKATTFTAKVNNAILVDKATVKSKMNSAILIDSRTKEDYDAGHIGNAISIPSAVILNDSKLKSASELTVAFAKVPKDKEVILYCRTGNNAGFMYFVMKSVLGYPNVKVYDGAYLDWTH